MGLRRTRTTAGFKARCELMRIKPSLEAMEGRLLLSQGVVAHPVIEARRDLISERIQQYRERNQAYAAEHSTDLSSLTGGVNFTKDTVSTGKKLATSGNVLDVGAKFVKQSFVKNTTKVGWDYLKAAAQGDGKTIRSLGNTPLVRSVGRDFTALGRSDAVQQVGRAFNSFGRAVSKTFHKVF